MLKHHSEAFSKRIQLVFATAVDVHAIDDDATFIGGMDTQKAFDQNCLTTATFA